MEHCWGWMTCMYDSESAAKEEPLQVSGALFLKVSGMGALQGPYISMRHGSRMEAEVLPA